MENSPKGTIVLASDVLLCNVFHDMWSHLDIGHCDSTVLPLFHTVVLRNVCCTLSILNDLKYPG